MPAPLVRGRATRVRAGPCGLRWRDGPRRVAAEARIVRSPHIRTRAALEPDAWVARQPPECAVLPVWQSMATVPSSNCSQVYVRTPRALRKGISASNALHQAESAPGSAKRPEFHGTSVADRERNGDIRVERKLFRKRLSRPVRKHFVVPNQSSRLIPASFTRVRASVSALP